MSFDYQLLKSNTHPFSGRIEETIAVPLSRSEASDNPWPQGQVAFEGLVGPVDQAGNPRAGFRAYLISADWKDVEGQCMWTMAVSWSIAPPTPSNIEGHA